MAKEAIQERRIRPGPGSVTKTITLNGAAATKVQELREQYKLYRGIDLSWSAAVSTLLTGHPAYKLD